jgi:5-methyltetrahydropteroyltriglutamate--homocysteine methyltransferase
MRSRVAKCTATSIRPQTPCSTTSGRRYPPFRGSTRPKPITKHDPYVFHPAATCKSRSTEKIDLGLVEEFKTVSALTRRPVKITTTSPLIVAKIAYDEYYNDLGKMMDDLAKLLRCNFLMLLDAGCTNIQVDEALFTVATEDEVTAAAESINTAIEGSHLHLSVHVCQGNYAVGKEYDGQIGHRYFDQGRCKADLIGKSDCSSLLIEYDMAHHYEGLLRNKQIGVGAVDVQDPAIESGSTFAERIRPEKWIAPEQTIITSSCGFNHLSRRTAIAKMRALADAKPILGNS